jgi:hypothetical protein
MVLHIPEGSQDQPAPRTPEQERAKAFSDLYQMMLRTGIQRQCGDTASLSDEDLARRILTKIIYRAGLSEEDTTKNIPQHLMQSFDAYKERLARMRAFNRIYKMLVEEGLAIGASDNNIIIEETWSAIKTLLDEHKVLQTIAATLQEANILHK